MRRLPLVEGATVADARVVVPAGDVAVEDAAATDTRLWVLDIDGGPSGLRVGGPDGQGLARVDVPAVSAIDGLAALGPDQVAFAVESFTRPRVWWAAAGDGPPEPAALAGESPFDLSGLQVRREFATSADGTRVPLTLVSRPGTRRDGTAAALLTGYGG